MEFPHLEKIAKQYEGKGLTVLAVNNQDSLERISAFYKDNGLAAVKTVMNDPGGANDAVAAYEVKGFPHTFIIGKDNRILEVMVGFHPQRGAAELRLTVEDLLAEQPPKEAEQPPKEDEKPASE